MDLPYKYNVFGGFKNGQVADLYMVSNQQTKLRRLTMKLFSLSLAVFLCFALSGFAAADKNYTLRVSMVISPGDPLYDGYENFAKRVEERSKGRMKVQVFPNAQLGKDEDVMEQALLGVDVAFNTDAGRLGVRVPEMGIVLAPYLFDDPLDAGKFMQSDLFKGWQKQLEQDHNLTLLSLNYYVGGRNFITKKPINSPKDLNGLRIRTPGAPVWQETIRALGATPVALPWIEVYPALQQGVVDGAEAQNPATYGSKLFEIGNHITLTNHILLMNGLVVGTTWYKKLPEDIQQILVEESFRAGEEVTKAVIASEKDFADKMAAEGATIHEVDVEPFRKSAEQAYKNLKLEDLRAQVKKILSK
jgi:tripartite ATP-independent transporter DctP family solute receptor